MPDNPTPPAKAAPDEGMTEMEKLYAGEHADTSKVFQEMDDSFWDATMEGMRDKPATSPPAPQAGPSGPAAPAP